MIGILSITLLAATLGVAHPASEQAVGAIAVFVSVLSGAGASAVTEVDAAHGAVPLFVAFAGVDDSQPVASRIALLQKQHQIFSSPVKNSVWSFARYAIRPSRLAMPQSFYQATCAQFSRVMMSLIAVDETP